MYYFWVGNSIILMFSVSFDLEELRVDPSDDSFKIYTCFEHHLEFRNRQNKRPYFIDITTSSSV